MQDNNNQFPRKTHNLIRLARNTDIILTEDQEVFLDEVNDFNLEARYPQFKSEFYRKCNREFAENYFRKIKEMMEWLKSHIKQK